MLGDMLELGPEEVEMHRRAGRQVTGNGWNVLLAVGPRARLIAEGAQSAGLPGARVTTFSTSEEAAAGIAALIEEGDLILVKGSRGMRMERVVQRLMDEFKEN